MSTKLAGKTALVTGATSGLGRHFAKTLSAAGARIVASGRNREALQSLQEEISASGAFCTRLIFDVTKPEDFSTEIDRAEKQAGPIDILVNSAGMSANGPAVQLGIAEYDNVLDTNLRGPFFLAQQIAQRLIARSASGRIINISSITAFRPLPGSAAYCMSKAAISMMTQVLAREWARHDINVNAICPGYIETALNQEWFQSEKGKAQVRAFPKRRLQQAADLDAILILLASDDSRAITGSLFTVDEGQSL